MTAPVITVYRNGDSHFSGKKLIVNRKQIRNFDNFLDKVTRDTQAGCAIRSIRTPNHGSRVSELEKIKNGGIYVAVGLERFKQLHYTGIQNTNQLVLSQKHITKEIKPILHSKVNASARYRKVAVAVPLRNRIIYVYQNGEDKFPGIKLLLDKWVLQSMDKVLQHITYKIKLRTGAVRSLYTVDGTEIKEPSIIETAQKYVAVGYNRPFIRLPYADVGILSITPRKSNQSKSSSTSSGSSPKYLFPTKPKLKLKKFSQDAQVKMNPTKEIPKEREWRKKLREEKEDNSIAGEEHVSFFEQIANTIENEYDNIPSVNNEPEFKSNDIDNTDNNEIKNNNVQVSYNSEQNENVTNRSLVDREGTYDSIKVGKKVQGFGSTFQKEAIKKVNTNKEMNSRKSSLNENTENVLSNETELYLNNSINKENDKENAAVNQSMSPKHKSPKKKKKSRKQSSGRKTSENTSIDTTTPNKEISSPSGINTPLNTGNSDKENNEISSGKNSLDIVHANSSVVVNKQIDIENNNENEIEIENNNENDIENENLKSENENKFENEILGETNNDDTDKNNNKQNNTYENKKSNLYKEGDVPTKKKKEEDKTDTADLEEEFDENGSSVYKATGKQKENATAVKDNQDTTVEKTLDMVEAEVIEDEEIDDMTMGDGNDYN